MHPGTVEQKAPVRAETYQVDDRGLGCANADER